jgi:hypothetical protein
MLFREGERVARRPNASCSDPRLNVTDAVFVVLRPMGRWRVVVAGDDGVQFSVKPKKFMKLAESAASSESEESAYDEDESDDEDGGSDDDSDGGSDGGFYGDLRDDGDESGDEMWEKSGDEKSGAESGDESGEACNRWAVTGCRWAERLSLPPNPCALPRRRRVPRAAFRCRAPAQPRCAARVRAARARAARARAARARALPARCPRPRAAPRVCARTTLGIAVARARACGRRAHIGGNDDSLGFEREWRKSVPQEKKFIEELRCAKDDDHSSKYARVVAFH